MIEECQVKFYLCDGWTTKELQKYVRSGGLVLRNADNTKTEEPIGAAYITTDFGTDFDIESLVSDGLIGKVCGWERYNNLKAFSDIEAVLYSWW